MWVNLNLNCLISLRVDLRKSRLCKILISSERPGYYLSGVNQVCLWLKLWLVRVKMYSSPFMKVVLM